MTDIPSDSQAAKEFDPEPVQPEKPLIRCWPQSVLEFEALVDDFQHRLVRYAFRRLECLEDAEDVIQKVFFKCYQERGKLKGVNRVSSYLYRMAANACTDFLRRKKTIEVPLEGGKVTALNSPDSREESLAAGELRRVEALLSRLPQRQAEVIRLRIFDQLGFAEIAEMLDCPIPTVKSRFKYGLDKLRETIRRNREVMR